MMENKISEDPVELTLEQKRSFYRGRVAIDALCDPWKEWDGMQEVVAEARTEK